MSEGTRMSSLDYTYEHLDDVIDRTFRVAPEIDHTKTALLVLDLQKLICDPAGAAYVESVAGAPAGQDVLGPVRNVIDSCRDVGMHIMWSLWGLEGDGRDTGIAALKWPGMEPGTPGSPATWGNRDAELVDGFEALPGEPVVYKHRFSSCYNTPVLEYMREWGIETLVICGVTSANCAHATTIDAWNQNYKVIVLADTTTSIPHPGENQPLGTGQHWEALRNIQMNYGDILTSQEFLALLNDSTGSGESMSLEGIKVALLAEDDYQELEMWYPYLRLQEAGAEVVVVGPKVAEYTSKTGYPIMSDVAAADADPADFDAVVVPGGFAPDHMRLCRPMIDLITALHSREQLVSSICHGGWMLVSAGVCAGKKITGYTPIKDDVVNAGGEWVEDAEVVIDGNVITSRTPPDLPAFGRELVAYLEKIAKAKRSEAA